MRNTLEMHDTVGLLRVARLVIGQQMCKLQITPAFESSNTMSRPALELRDFLHFPETITSLLETFLLRCNIHQ